VTTPRDPAVVIQAILAVVPESETYLRERLEFVARGVPYDAPESTRSWDRLSAVLGEEIGPPRLDWHHRVNDIMAGRASE
jgi:hypothetical protein